MHKEDENKYAYLDQLSTRELREILRADIDSPESGDDEAIFYILEVMDRREREHPSDASSDLDRCWNDFQTLYHTPEGAGRSLYPTEDPEEPKKTPQASVHGRRHVRWAVLAAVVALLVVSLTVPVAGFANLFEMIGTWTAQQFAIRTEDEDTPGGSTKNFEGAQVFGKTPGDELRQVLAEYGITEAVVPTWMPEGFEIQGEVFVEELPAPQNVQLFALYSDGVDSISISIVQYVSTVEGKIYEKTVENPIIYTVGETEYHLFQSSDNLTLWSAVYYDDDLECSINTTLTKADLEKILDSIYEE